MKKNIHPKWNKEVKVMHNGKAVMTVGSTVQTINAEIWAGNHPFYTGKEMLVDTDNRVDSFNKKLNKQSGNLLSKRLKRERKAKTKSEEAKSAPVTLKDMLQNLK